MNKHSNNIFLILILIIFLSISLAGCQTDSKTEGRGSKSDLLTRQLNAHNGGQVVQDEDTVYFSIFTETIYVEDDKWRSLGKLYKSDPDGSQFTLLAEDHAAQINVAEEWIYYLNMSDEYAIYRIRKNGSDRERLTDGNVWALTLDEEWLYYTKDYSIHRARLDGSEDHPFISRYADSLSVQGDWFYFLDLDFWELRRVRKSGASIMQEELLVPKEKAVYHYGLDEDELIYVTDEGQIYRRKTEEKDGEGVLLKDGGPLWGFNASEDWFYYVTQDGIYRMRQDGSRQELILAQTNLDSRLAIAGGWIYYTPVEDTLHKVTLDGKNARHVVVN